MQLKHIVGGLAAALVLSQVGPAPARRFGPLIDGEQLNRLQARAERGREDLVILDLSDGTADDPMATHKAGHIPGARFVNWREEINQFPFPILTEGSAGALQVPVRRVLQAKLRDLGVNRRSRVVLYDNFRNRAAIRAMFVMEYFGKARRVHILEGGVAAYTAADGALDTCGWPADCPQAERRGRIRLRRANTAMTIDFDGRGDAPGIRDLVSSPREGTTIIDARPYSMFIGDRIGGCIHPSEPVYRRGHMPGALARPWPDNESAPGYFKPTHELAELYTNIDDYGDEEIVLYCNEGLHAVYDWFVLTKLLGYPKHLLKVYEGSIGEYSRQSFKPGVYASSPQVSGCDVDAVAGGPECRDADVYPPPALMDPPPAWYTGP